MLTRSVNPKPNIFGSIAGGKFIRGASRGLFVVGAAFDVYNIATADDKVRETTKVAGGWVGGAAGAKGGAAVGATIGGVIGGIGGYFLGMKEVEQCMISSNSQTPTWLVYRETNQNLAMLTLTTSRIYPDGQIIAFDADPDHILDSSHDQEYQLLNEVLSNWLAAYQVMSYALSHAKTHLLTLFKPEYRFCCQQSRSTLITVFEERGLRNTNGTEPDFIFLGGEPHVHQESTLQAWVQMFNRHASIELKNPAISQILKQLDGLIMTISTEVHFYFRRTQHNFQQHSTSVEQVAVMVQ
ncbi:hypothetical protein [Herpetosiphon geysericola]|uniref:hypothetical protein n=1 Tax=Herpetosiphon geysericola TaxID=70996 RepID=UPI00128F70CF|nr:hypothetical protein [Herpetosiphon geysericola]